MPPTLPKDLTTTALIVLGTMVARVYNIEPKVGVK